MKKEIVNKLNTGQLEGIEDLIKEYEKFNPNDLDTYSIKGTYYYITGQYDEAIKILKKGLEKNRYNFDLLYNLSICYEKKGEYIKAITEKHRAYLVLNCYINTTDYEEIRKELADEIDEFFNNISMYVEKASLRGRGQEFLEEFKEYKENQGSGLGYMPMLSWSFAGETYLGSLRYDDSYYIGIYSKHNSFDPFDKSRKVEIIKTIKNFSRQEENKNTLRINKESLVPILLKKDEPLEFEYKREKYRSAQLSNIFYFYKIDSDLKILNKDYILGKPIALEANSDKKKLIISIFIDGLSEYTLSKRGIENLMPKTAKLFSDGIYFKNFYSSSDWTFPSMASYFTGLDVVKHKIYTNKVQGYLPKDVKTLGEMMKESGFVTSKIDGGWRTSPDMGHLRGFDRAVYAPYADAMDVKDIISEAIDTIDLFKDTNHYLYINILELHDIADNYSMKHCTNKNIDIEDRQTEFFKDKSVMHTEDKHKEARYEEQISYIDKYLNILYNHIYENFEEDEVIISIFSDHGQGYLVEDGKFYLDDARTKVPLLIKGCSDEFTSIDEYVSSTDYLQIMNKLAGLDIEINSVDSNLPMFLGGQEKEYVVSESIHVDRPYRLAIRNKDYCFFLETKALAKEDGRVSFKEYDCWLYDVNGQTINDKELLAKFEDLAKDRMKEFIIYD